MNQPKSKISKSSARSIARERIKILFTRAAEISASRPDLANRYVTLARKLAMRHKSRIPALYKRRICTHCYTYLISGSTARIRTREGKLIIYCLHCKHHTRIPLQTSRSTRKTS